MPVVPPALAMMIVAAAIVVTTVGLGANRRARRCADNRANCRASPAADRGANATLTIDLVKQEIRGPDGGTATFEIDPFRKHCLLNGLDDIGLTMEKKPAIDVYEEKAKRARAWA